MIAAHTYDVILNYHVGVLSVSKWFLALIVCAFIKWIVQ